MRKEHSFSGYLMAFTFTIVVSISELVHVLCVDVHVYNEHVCSICVCVCAHICVYVCKYCC